MTLRKRWGQNYLVNRGAREKLVSLLAVEAGMRAWEIGPGLGAMTAMLLAVEGLRGLTVFEIDARAVAFLQSRFSGHPGLRIVAGDVLDTWQGEAEGSGLPDRVLGNLPYASASAIIASLIEAGAVAERCVFTVQKELAERMLARPGSESYSSFSIFCRSACRIEKHGDLRPGSFYPAPEVLSTIVSLGPRPPEESPADWKLFRSLVRGLFASRRKTLRSSIAAGRVPSGLAPGEVLAACAEAGIDVATRPEEHDVVEWVRLADLLARSAAR
jgi:16S rRNA (adenine1518-N6/adenine1519-N6)-dimethyltransferase